MEDKLELAPFLTILKRMIKFEIERLQWDINYYMEHDREVMKDDILVLKGRVAGLKSSLAFIDSSIKEMEHQIKFDQFINGMTTKLDQMMELIDKKRT